MITKDVNKLLIKLSRYLCYYVYYHDTLSFITSNWLTCLLLHLSTRLPYLYILYPSVPFPSPTYLKEEGEAPLTIGSVAYS